MSKELKEDYYTLGISEYSKLNTLEKIKFWEMKKREVQDFKKKSDRMNFMDIPLFILGISTVFLMGISIIKSFIKNNFLFCIILSILLIFNIYFLIDYIGTIRRAKELEQTHKVILEGIDARIKHYKDMYK